MSDTADLSGGDATPAAPSSTALAAQEGANADTDERLQEAGGDEQEGDGEEQPAAEYHTLTIDGEEVELTLDELKAGYGKNRASQKRFQEAAELKRSVLGFVSKLKSADVDTITHLFSKIGVDFDDIAEKRLRAKLEEMDMPPDKRGMREVERERERLRRERAEWDQQRGEASLEAETERRFGILQQEVTSELSRAGLPDSQPIRARVAGEIANALQAGHTLSTADAVDIVWEEMRVASRRLPPDALRRLMGDAPAADNLRRGEAQRVSTEQKRQRAAPAKAAAPAPVKRMRVDPEDGDALKALFDS